MKIIHDTKADAVYISLKEGAISRTVEVNNHTIVDLDEHDAVIGIEILNASTHHAAGKPSYESVCIPAV